MKKALPCGAAIFAIFGIENSENPSHYDLHIKTFHPPNGMFLLNISMKSYQKVRNNTKKAVSLVPDSPLSFSSLLQRP